MPKADRILVVDDEEEIRKIICRMLASADYQCRAVAGGLEALALLESGEKFELLLTDLLNSPMDGFSLLQLTKKKFPNVAVVVASAIHDQSFITACIREGACDYLVHPFEREQLLVAVRRALEHRRLQLENRKPHFAGFAFNAEGMNSALRRNAFRCLSLPGDVELKEIYRRQKRLEITLEMGDSDLDDGLHFLPAPSLNRESILEAVHRLEKDSTRLGEEVFWLHGLQGKIDLNADKTDVLLAALRSQSDANTTIGAVAQHNAAVVLTCLAIESEGGKCLDYWKDALKLWRETYQNPTFWHFLEDRHQLENDSAAPEQLKQAVGTVLAKAVMDEVWESIRQREFYRISSIIAAVSVHGDWLPLRDELARIAQQVAADATTRAGSIMDRMSALQKDGDKQAARRALIDVERDFRTLAQEIDPILECLGTADSVDWPDTKASVLEKLSIAHFNHLDENDAALKFIVEATNLAKSSDVRSRLDAAWRHVQQSIFCGEALKLLANDRYIEAEQKLSAAIPLATEEQKREIAELQKACRRARVFKGVDRSKKSPTLYTVNGIGATFYGRRDFDADTKSYVTTHWFTVVFVPVIPLGAYRVSDAGSNSYNIYGRVQLSSFLKKYRWGVLAALALLIVWGSINSSSSSNTDSPRSNPSTAGESSGGGTAYAPATQSTVYQESAAIEAERGELKTMNASLDSQKEDLDAQSAAIAAMQAYFKSVESTYTADTVPDAIRDRYNSTIDDYNRRLPAFKGAVREYKEAVEVFEARRKAFNARIQRYSASR